MPGQRDKIENESYKLTKRSIGEVQPQTKADNELQLKLDCLAPFVAYAVLCARLMSSLHELKTWKCLNAPAKLLAVVL